MMEEEEEEVGTGKNSPRFSSFAQPMKTPSATSRTGFALPSFLDFASFDDAGGEFLQSGSSVGFMDLLGLRDLVPTAPMFDSPHAEPPSLPSPPSPALPESTSEVLNAPATPNSSSLSSSSTQLAPPPDDHETPIPTRDRGLGESTKKP